MTIANDRASEVDVTPEDLTVLDGIDDDLPGSTSPQAGDEPEGDDLQSTSQAGGDTVPASGSQVADGEEVDDDARIEAELAELDKELNGEDEDASKDTDTDGTGEGDEALEGDVQEEVTDADDGPDGDEEVVEAPQPEVVEQIKTSYAEIDKNLDALVLQRVLPDGVQLAQQITAAQQELDAFDAKFTGLDEDGFPVNPTYQENKRIIELTRIVDKGMDRLDAAAARMDEILPQARQEAWIRTNLQANPVLQKYEDGFRKMTAKGIQPESFEEAVELSKLYSANKPTKTATPAKPSAPKPTAAQVQQQVLQQNIDKKAGMKVTAGKGSAGKAASAKPANPYAGLSEREADDMKYFDAELASLR